MVSFLALGYLRYAIIISKNTFLSILYIEKYVSVNIICYVYIVSTKYKCCLLT